MGEDRVGGDAIGAASSVGPSNPGVWTVPNLLSMLRVIGVPIFVWAILTKRDGIALATLMASGISDYLDGTIARKFGLVSTLGRFLDPLADRLYIASTVLGFAWREIVPWWLVGVLVARELVLVAVLLLARGRGQIGLPVNFIGKAATFNLLMAFPALLMGTGEGLLGDVMLPIGWALLWWGAGLYWLAALLYAVQLRGLGAPPPAGQPAKSSLS